jgi:stage II sporulation protein D
MKIRVLILLFFTILFVSPKYAIQLDIGLFCNYRLKHVQFETNFGEYSLVNKGNTIEHNQGDNIKIQYHNDSVRIKINDKYVGHYDTLYFLPKQHNNIFQLTGLSPSTKSRKYYTQLKVFTSHNRLVLVNQIDLERYLIGVLESEVGKDESKEFYKVHAIMSRTYALKHKHKFSDSGYNLTDLVNCQVYHGKMYKNKKISDAVKETKNLVLVDENMDYITASYYSNSGGQTAAVEDVWLEPLPYLRSVKDPYSVGTHNFTWNKTISKDRWLNYLQSKHRFPIDDKKALNSALNFKQSYRRKYFISWDYHILLTDIRKDLKLKSTFFSVTDKGENILLSGKGFGHGVGLSQEGAMQMIKLGFGFLEVLKFYYTDIHIINLQMRDFYLSD